MSYILDALQKAAADRQRGQVPTLAPQTPLAAGPTAAARRRPAPAWLALLGIGLAAVLLGAWWWAHRGPAENAGPVPAATTLPPPSAPTGEPGMAAAAAAIGEPTAPATAAADLPFQASAAPILAPAPAPTPAPAAAAPEAPRPAAATPAPAALAGELKVSGSTYSDNPQHRMLIVNGQVVREGQQVRPGLTLEVIGPHSAILNEGGRRFNLNY